jgi:hypothetical protein
LSRSLVPTRWSTTLSSKVNWPHEINFRDLCGAVASKSRSDIRANGTLVLHRMERLYQGLEQFFLREGVGNYEIVKTGPSFDFALVPTCRQAVSLTFESPFRAGTQCQIPKQRSPPILRSVHRPAPPFLAQAFGTCPRSRRNNPQGPKTEQKVLPSEKGTHKRVFSWLT